MLKIAEGDIVERVCVGWRRGGEHARSDRTSKERKRWPAQAASRPDFPSN